MTIYVIKGNNNEMYEDYYEWIEGVYIAKGNAEKELRILRTKANEDYEKDMFYPKRQYNIEKYETKD